MTFCVIDYTAFSQIVRIIAQGHYFDDTPPDWVRPKAISAIRKLVEHGLIEAGELHAPNGKEFLEIASSAEDLVAYIETEWDKLDGEPKVGAICWFKATRAGKELANSLGIGGKSEVG